MFGIVQNMECPQKHTIAYETNEFSIKNCQKHAIAYETDEIMFFVEKVEQKNFYCSALSTILDFHESILLLTKPTKS